MLASMKGHEGCLRLLIAVEANVEQSDWVCESNRGCFNVHGRGWMKLCGQQEECWVELAVLLTPLFFACVLHHLLPFDVVCSHCKVTPFPSSTPSALTQHNRTLHTG